MNALLTADDYLRFPPAEPDFRVPYGEHPLQFAELSLPDDGDLRPVIILIHGGCYREIYNLHPLGGVVNALTDMGFAVWNVEYRRHGCGGAFPAMFMDVAAAADKLRAIASQFNLDLSRVISCGHSAGGHLALWLAGRRKIPRKSPLHCDNPLPIHATLALAPLTDIARAAIREACGEALLEVMGGNPHEAADNYRAGSPMELLPLYVPQAIIVGEHDNDILSEARDYVQSATNLGDKAQLTVVPDAGHFEIVHPDAAAWQSVRNALAALSPANPANPDSS